MNSNWKQIVGEHLAVLRLMPGRFLVYGVTISEPTTFLGVAVCIAK